MRRTSSVLGICIVVALLFGGVRAAAEEVTLHGTLMCAKCSLKKADAKECQDVLVTKDSEGTTTEYYIAANEVSKKFGHTCNNQAEAMVTGTVSEKDGKKWIAASKIEKH